MQTNNKLREALANLVDVIDRCDSGSPLWWHGGAKGVVPLKNAKAALAEPVKNCEVGTAEEQALRFVEFCGKHHTAQGRWICHECPCNGNMSEIPHCLTKWMQMPYEDGVGNAD